MPLKKNDAAEQPPAEEEVTPAETPGAEEPPAKNPHAQALGRLGGLKGGAARAKSLTPEQRKEIARKAAAKRWGKKSS